MRWWSEAEKCVVVAGEMICLGLIGGLSGNHGGFRSV
jgi:hypothetical protein